MTSMEKVLLVDDEEKLLAGLSRQLREKFDILTASSGDAAVGMLKKERNIAVIVCDMRMPGMNGIQVLKEFSKKSPATSRIILTGFASQECAVDSINQGHVFKFINKPCTMEVLAGSIQEGLEHHRLLIKEKNLLERALAGSIKLLADVVSLKDQSAAESSRRLSVWANLLLPHIPEATKGELDFSIMLAPLGRMFVPAEVLVRQSKGESLSEKDLAILTKAPEIGSNLLANIPRMETISRSILYQDKNFDGTGFPDDRTFGENIPVIARLLHLLNALLDTIGDDDLTNEHFDQLSQQDGKFDLELLELARKHLFDGGETSSEEKEIQVEVEEVPEPQEEEDTGPETEIVRTATLREGKQLATDLLNTEGSLVLAEGTILTQEQVEKIRLMYDQEKLPLRVEIIVPS